MISRRAGLAALAGAFSGNTSTVRQRTVAFRYSATFSPDELRWCTRFALLVTGGILAPDVSRQLRQNGTRLVAYRWSSAFYPGDQVSAAADWQAEVHTRRKDWLLNKEPVGGGAAEGQRKADWYDFGNPQLIEAWSTNLNHVLQSSGYDGLFFDTLGAAQLPAPVLAEFRARHPNADYDQMQGRFLKQLRAKLGVQRLIFTNQGYRNPAIYLPWADLDLSESTFTYIGADGSTQFRRWRDLQSPWTSIVVPMQKLIEPAAQRFPHVQFVHANYAAGARRDVKKALLYAYACAKLWDATSYLICPGTPSAEHDEIYFTDLGKPLEATFQEEPGGNIAWRAFERGTVAVNAGRSAGRITVRKSQQLLEPQTGYLWSD